MSTPKLVGDLIASARGNGSTSWLLALILSVLLVLTCGLYRLINTVEHQVAVLHLRIDEQLEPVSRVARILLVEDQYGLAKIHAMIKAVEEGDAQIKAVQSGIDQANDLLNQMNPPPKPSGD